MNTFGLVFFVLYLSSVIATDQQTEFRDNLLGECKESEHATDNDVKVVKNHEVPETETGKCLIACLMEKVGILVNDKVQSEVINSYTKQKHKDNAEAIKTSEEITKTCGKAVENVTGRCKVAYEYSKCAHEELKKRGIMKEKN